jgi:hypothetical protein
MPVPQYPPCAGDCPPSDATPINGYLYRSAKKFPLDSSEFVPLAERTKMPQDMAKCQCWGLSVWLTEAAVTHALQLFDYMRSKRYVVKASLAPVHGVIRHTPDAKQPDHHTFWKSPNKDLSSLFEVYRTPELSKKK